MRIVTNDTKKYILISLPLKTFAAKIPKKNIPKKLA